MFKETYNLLPAHYRKKLIPIISIILGRALLDLIGLAVILPVFYLFVQPDAVNSKYFHKFIEFTGTTPKALVLACICVILILAVKAVLVIILNRTQSIQMFNLYKYFSSKLLKIYYNRGYLAIKEDPATDFAYKINAVCLVFVNQMLSSLFSMIADITMLTFLLVLAFILSPAICMAIIVCALPTIIIYTTYIKNKLVKYGRQVNEAQREQYSTITNTFRGYPEMVVNGVFPVMEKKFTNGLNTISSTFIKYAICRQIPSYLMEISIVICAGLLTLIQMKELINVPGAIALFGVAAIKVLPSIKGIIASWSAIKNSTYSVETIKEALNSEKAGSESNVTVSDENELLSPDQKFANLNLKSVSFSFPSLQIFDNFNLTLNKGDKLGIRGVSGKGKSTLFNIMLGLYPVEKGEVLLNGKKLQANLGLWNKMCGYVPQDVFVMNMSIAENIAIGIDFKVKRKQDITLRDVLVNKEDKNIVFDIPQEIKEKIFKVLELAHLKDFVDSLPNGIYTVVGDGGCKLSGGQKQRLGIARALFKSPQVLFFDEATSALNNEMEIEITNAIERISLSDKSITIVIIAHRQSSLKICDRIIDI